MIIDSKARALKKRCFYCDKELDSLVPWRCKYCNQYVCADHRLPENHDCENFDINRNKNIDNNFKEPLINCYNNEEIEEKKPRINFRFKLKRIKRIINNKINHNLRGKIPSFEFIRLLSIITKIVLIIFILLIVPIVFISGLDWASNIFPNENYYLSLLPFFIVIAVCHELMHAMVWWLFGYFAVPIPILIPPVLGITFGDKPDSFIENVFISLAPLILTISGYIATQNTGNELYYNWGLVNAAGMIYDFISIFH